MAQQSIEERLAYLESKIAEYDAERAQMRELAGLRADIKELRDDTRLRIHAIGVEIRDEINTQADALRTEYHAGYTYLGERIGGVEEAVKHLQTGQNALQAGQQQILDILLGKPKRND